MIVQAPEMREEKKVKKVNQHPKQRGFHIKQPHKLFDHIRTYYKVSSDAALAHMLDLSTPELSRYRNGQKRVGARVILAVYDATKMPIEDIREMLK